MEIIKQVLKRFWILIVLLFITLPLLIHNIPELVPQYIRIIKNPKEAASIIKNFNTKKDINNIDCSNLERHWWRDKNIYFEDNKIKLKAGERAGAISLKKNISTVFDIGIVFKSFINNGINTNISFQNGDAEEIKYAIGDGDFQSIRYYGIGRQISTPTSLVTAIDNSEKIKFKASIVERETGNEIVSSLTYLNRQGEMRDSLNLNTLPIFASSKPYFNISFGLDVGQGKLDSNAYIELISCTIIDRSLSE